MFRLIQSGDQKLLLRWKNEKGHSYRVHSRFEHAVNMMNDSGEMITLLTQDLPNAPNTLLVNMDNFNALYFDQDDSLMVSSNDLKLGEELFVMNEETHLWNDQLPTLKYKDLSSIQERIDRFLCNNSEPLFDIENKIYEKLDECYRNIIHACLHQQYNELSGYIQQTIGLGLGLTPSGDDRLVGFLLGCFASSAVNESIIDAIQLTINNSQNRTNEISYAMLHSAGQGRFNEWCINLIYAVNQSDDTVLDDAIQKVFSIGSRSGGDMLKGFSLWMNLQISEH